MKRPNHNYKNILIEIAQKVQFEILNEMNDERVVPVKDSVIEESDTCGWYIDIFRFKKIKGRGSVQIWLDKFPNIERPILSVCFWSSDINRINKVANSSLKNFFDDHPYKIKKVGRGKVLERPLARKYFENYLVEPYPTKFCTYYFIDEISYEEKISPSFVRKITTKTKWLIRATTEALKIDSISKGKKSILENGKIWQEHYRRERSKILADNVKIRDGFQCIVCDFNFTNKYGVYGNGFAEAHHIIALSKIKRKVKTTEDDLITVCSNCHRMLHRMEGRADDYKTLRKLVMKRLPAVKRVDSSARIN